MSSEFTSGPKLQLGFWTLTNIISSILDVKRRKSQACLLTLDFFKAYDRVLLDFLIKVMKKMNFGDLFTS